MQAVHRVWDAGHENFHVMLPFVRTASEVRERCRALVAQSGLLQRRGFELWIMAEVPSVLFNLERYAKLGIAGISIGSNDLTQLMLGVDRDSEVLAATFDERDPAVVDYLSELIPRARELDCGPRSADRRRRYTPSTPSCSSDWASRTSRSASTPSIGPGDLSLPLSNRSCWTPLATAEIATAKIASVDSTERVEEASCERRECPHKRAQAAVSGRRPGGRPARCGRLRRLLDEQAEPYLQHEREHHLDLQLDRETNPAVIAGCLSVVRLRQHGQRERRRGERDDARLHPRAEGRTAVADPLHGHPRRARGRRERELRVPVRRAGGGAPLSLHLHGRFSDVFKWPASAVGYPLTFRAVIASDGASIDLDYPVQVRR